MRPRPLIPGWSGSVRPNMRQGRAFSTRSGVLGNQGSPGSTRARDQNTRVIKVLAVAQSILYNFQKLGHILCALLSTWTINPIFACRRSPELGPPSYNMWRHSGKSYPIPFARWPSVSNAYDCDETSSLPLELHPDPD